MTWALPSLLSLLLLVPIVMAVVFVGLRRRQAAMLSLASVEALARLVPPRAGRARAWQAFAAIVTCACVSVAMAGPRLGFDYQQRKVQGVSIVVVMDVSRSMDAADVSPSRLEVARRKVKDFSAELTGDSIGLVIFAAGAFARIPLTVDYDTFRWAVEDSSSQTIRAQGTALGGALEAATQMLTRAQGSGKAILLVSDGVGHDDDAELNAAVNRANEAGIRIYALGIGDPAGAPIPLAEGGFKNDASGGVVLTKLDEAKLKGLASATGGAYVRAVASNDDVRALYRDEIRAKLEVSERGERREKVWRERFQWPLGIALFAMAGSALFGIGGRRQSRLIGTAVVLFLAGFAAPARANSTSEGLAAYHEKKWDDAAKLLGQARVEHPGDVEVGHALAESLYRSGRYREAEQVFESLAASDAQHRATHLYNAGNSAYRGGRLDDAARDFSGATQADPDLAAAKKNADAVQKEIAMRLQQKPPENKEDSEKKQDAGDKQDGQQQDGQAGDPQAGGEKNGEPSSGDSQQAQKDAAPDDNGQLDPEPGEKKQGEDGQQQDAPTAGDMAKQDGDPEGNATVAKPTGKPGDLTKEEAARLVDGVKDGTPRVAVGGNDTEKDW